MKRIYLMIMLVIFSSLFVLAGCDSCGCGGRGKDSGIMSTPEEYQIPEKMNE